jgi:hypothetical protein
MYKIIGGDQREYGPATAEELRQWIAEGRLSAQSLVQVEGTGQWKPLSAYPEFAAALGAQPRLGPAPPAEAPPWSADALARHPRVDIGDCLARSWNLLRRDPGLLLGAAFLFWLIQTLCQGFRTAGMVYLVFQGVFYGGLSMIYLNRFRDRPASLGGVFAGFSHGFAQLLLAGFLSSLLSWLAACCCLVVPGVYLFVAWLFCVPLVADRGLEFWSAMELSRRTVTRIWFQVFALFLLAFLPTLVMNLLIQVKLAAAAYPAVQGLLSPGTPPDLTRLLEVLTKPPQAARITPALLAAVKLVSLFNLPFGLGALLAAYENLFGPRPPSPP